MDTSFKPTWLYLKQHNKTGLKYFGKTVRDPKNYYGSGIHWKAHLKKHGYDVTTVWKKLFTNKEDITKFALEYSQKNNIVESQEYANLKPEDGVMGGDTGITHEGREKLREYGKKYRHSEATKEKIRTARLLQTPGMLGKSHSEETKQKIKDARSKQIMTPRSEEFKQKMSALHKGKVVTEETRRKISEARKRALQGEIS
jgi:hypothetical protein